MKSEKQKTRKLKWPERVGLMFLAPPALLGIAICIAVLAVILPFALLFANEIPMEDK